MARFFLHFRSGMEFVEDEEGLELLAAQAAHVKVVASLRDVLAADIPGGILNVTSVIEIADEHHKIIKVVRFNEVVKIIERVDGADS